MDSRRIKTTLRFSVLDVRTSLTFAAGCSTATPASSLVIAALTPVTIKFTNGSLANDLPAPGAPGPVSSEREPKPSAWSISPTGPRKQEPFLGVLTRDLAGSPRHRRPNARDTSQGPKVA